MTVEIFLTLLSIFSVISSLITEAIKEFLKGQSKQHPMNIIVLTVSMAVGFIGVATFYAIKSIPFSLINVMFMFFMGVANWVCAMVGYDKIKQALDQLKK